jgi:hypothetical protein
MNNNEENNIIIQLLLEAENISDQDFGSWYEKKRKLFSIGIKKTPTKDEFIKYLNYASAMFPPAEPLDQ